MTTATKARPRAKPAKRANIVEAMDSIFRPWFPLAADGTDTWSGWKAVLKAMDALPMTAGEIEFFKTIAGGREPPTRRVSEFVAVAARRTGKDSATSAIAAYAAATFDQQDKLRPGERGVVLCLACDRVQARIVLNYIRSYFRGIPALKAMVVRETASGFELNNGIDITVATSSFRSTRGRPVLLAIIDEAAFMRSETSATPDMELYAALRPALLTIPGSRIIIISSPYRKAGLLWERYRKFFGRNDDNVLVIQAAVRQLNPTISQAAVDAEIEEDPAKAVSEILGQFRDDISSFINRETVEACVVPGRRELPPLAYADHVAFCDPSGGLGDAMTMAVAHRENEQLVVLDAIREVRPPFSPEAVVAEFCQLLKSYRITSVVGDKYGGIWPKEKFAVHGIDYQAHAKPKSEIYRDILASINSGQVELLDNATLINQLCNLERRTARGGRDSIDHPQGAAWHDDTANAVCGALLAAEMPEAKLTSVPFWAGFDNPDTEIDDATHNLIEAEEAYRAGELRPRDVMWLMAERARRATRARR